MDKSTLLYLKKNTAKKYRHFLRRKLDFANRTKLNNRDFSIICSNCIGGVIYHELGLQFMSPTINLFLYPGDFLKLIYHLEHYLNYQGMIQDEGKTEELGYPVGILDDIHLYFGHYADFSTARYKWYECCRRVNYDNLYFMMIQRDGCTEDDLRKFDSFSSDHKVVFTDRNRTDIKSSFYIPGSVSNGQVIDLVGYKNKLSGRRWIDDFDYVEFLNK